MQEIDVPEEGIILKDRSGKEYLVYSSTKINGLVVKSKQSLQIIFDDSSIWLSNLGYKINLDKLFFNK
jgi:hypothetical protein